MKTKEYDEVDPWEVLHLNLLCLDYALTPERVAFIRRLDPRPFPLFAIYAVEDGIVVGQMGVFRLPMVTVDGFEDVGGIWAVCTHPTFEHRGIATRLMEEAHARMREIGLRFSTLGTKRYRVAHMLYLKQGYEDMVSSFSTFAPAKTIKLETPFRAEKAGLERLPLADDLFRRVASGRLGFARRHFPFFPSIVQLGDLKVDDVWFLWNDEELVGYATAHLSDSVLSVSDVLLLNKADTASAIAALVKEMEVSFIRVRVYQKAETVSLLEAGFRMALPDWDTFMVRPLVRDLKSDYVRTLFGIGTERFLISWLDTT